jgi:hypothetical protein
MSKLSILSLPLLKVCYHHYRCQIYWSKQCLLSLPSRQKYKASSVVVVKNIKPCLRSSPFTRPFCRKSNALFKIVAIYKAILSEILNLLFSRRQFQDHFVGNLMHCLRSSPFTRLFCRKNSELFKSVAIFKAI